MSKTSKIKARRKARGCINPTSEVKAGPCEICGKVLESLHFDHDHATGLFRGWLCGACNRGLGFFCDDVALLRKAAQYVENQRSKVA